MNKARGNVPIRAIARFKKAIRSHYLRHGRNLPWRNTKNPYRILVSEIMLQQTQVSRVLRTYHRFIKRFPNFQSLARASPRSILLSWRGLGYNRRALGLKKLSGIVAGRFRGRLPHDPRVLEKLPGIGPGTAGAIAAFAFNIPAPFIETNIRRTFIHFFFPHQRKVRDEEIFPLISRTMDRRNPREWYSALMDYGAMLGRSGVNPNRKSALHRTQPRFSGSTRELRGKIVALLLKSRSMRKEKIAALLDESPGKISLALAELAHEGFLTRQKKNIMIRTSQHANA
ncbi:MAG: A/G-specific adenine glycosylase [Candidatus Liptonbacteria bacterium]|nr:A/G-specific adenine glycosylase [Candidatus Liptonbacteria bacterium]